MQEVEFGRQLLYIENITIYTSALYQQEEFHESNTVHSKYKR